MGKSKRQTRTKHLQPASRHQTPAPPADSAQRVTHLSAPQVLARIERARLARDDAETELAALIDHAADLGVGWPEIAARLNVTRQAARQHYLRRHPDGASREDHVA